LFLPNSASETTVSSDVSTVRLTQGNLNYFADLAVKGNTRAKVDFDNGRQVTGLRILDLHREDIVRAFR
jgi:hypothetical protein